MPHLSLLKSNCNWLAVMVLACLLPSHTPAETLGPNILPAGKFENVAPTYVPWAGVDSLGNIHGLEGKQWAVAEDGGIRRSTFGPSIAVADMNGDGKPDLVLGDSEGFFWLYINSGTPQKPAFTQGEVIPIWLGEEALHQGTEGVESVVPRIQLVDFDGSKKYDIVTGSYVGSLYRIHNQGSSAAPMFKPTYDKDTMLINTHRRGILWCNYLAPFLTTAFGTNSMDLVMGEGTYSANSIYLLQNTGNPQQPSFDEDHMQKIIPGMGLEQLTPVVVDWNNDGKPDILCGSRTGYLVLYLNNSTDPAHPTFAPGVHVKIAGVEKLGNSITVALGDLTGNHLPNLLIGRDDGTVLYALNTGTIGAPVFTTLALPIKGVLPPTYHYVALRDWSKLGAWGAPDELVGAVNPKLEPGFTFPDGETTSKYALKFSVWPVTNTYFPERFYPKIEDEWRQHMVVSTQSFNINLNKRYRIHCWVKANGSLSDFRYKLTAGRFGKLAFEAPDVTNPLESGTSWTEVTSEFKVSNPNDPTTTTWSYRFEFRFTGQTTFYVDDLQIQQED